MATAVVGGVDAVAGAYGTGTMAIARANEGVVAGVGARDFGEVVVDAAEGADGVGGAAVDMAEGAAGVGDAVGVVAIVVGAEVAEADASVAATCAEVGVEGADVVLEDGGGATPFMRSRISFIRRNFSSILDIEAQR